MLCTLLFGDEHWGVSGVARFRGMSRAKCSFLVSFVRRDARQCESDLSSCHITETAWPFFCEPRLFFEHGVFVSRRDPAILVPFPVGGG